MAGNSVKSHRLSLTVPIKDREASLPVPSPCKVTHGYFPTPGEALDRGWTPKQIMDSCRRMPQEDLTDELRGRLLAVGLTEKQIAELYRHKRSWLDRFRSREATGDPFEDGDLEENLEDDDVGTGIKLASLEEAERYGIKLPDAREENDEMGELTFAKGLVIGMPAKEALEKCIPSRMKDITKELLQECVESGLTRDEIAKGFGTTLASLNWKASQVKFKFPNGRKCGGHLGADQEQDNIAAANKTAALTGTDVEALTGDDAFKAMGASGALSPQPDSAAESNPPVAPEPAQAGGVFTGPAWAVVGEPAEEEPVAPISGAKTTSFPSEPDAADEWEYTFGVQAAREAPVLIITSNGKLTVRRMEIDDSTRYAFKFDKEFRRCKLVAHHDGAGLRKADGGAYVCTVRSVAAAVREKGIGFPVKFELDPATMEGERKAQ